MCSLLNIQHLYLRHIITDMKHVGANIGLVKKGIFPSVFVSFSNAKLRFNNCLFMNASLRLQVVHTMDDVLHLQIKQQIHFVFRPEHRYPISSSYSFFSPQNTVKGAIVPATIKAALILKQDYAIGKIHIRLWCLRQ